MTLKTILRNSAVVAFLSLGLAGCNSDTPLSGDWFRCKVADCAVLDSTGTRFGDATAWQMLHQLGISEYSPDLGYCSGRGPDDTGTYEWDGSTLKMTDSLGRDAGGGAVEFPDEETMRMTDRGGVVHVFKKITPSRLTGPCT